MSIQILDQFRVSLCNVEDISAGQNIPEYAQQGKADAFDERMSK